MNFELPPGETLNLNCEIIWVSKTLYSEKKNAFGMKIIDPPPKYKEFVENCPFFNYY